MNILYVGDNRNRTNWGCRATSTALGTILRSAATISGTMDGQEIGGHSMTPVPWSGRLPRTIANAVDRLPLGPAGRARDCVKRWLNVTDDFVVEDPNQSATLFLRIKGQHPVLAHIWDQLTSADSLVINGEGSYIFSAPPRRDTLFYNFLLALAQRIGKPTYVLNAMFSDCPKSGHNHKIFRTTLAVLGGCRWVSARDPQSFAMLNSAQLSSNVTFHPDALFTWHNNAQDWTSSIMGDVSKYEPFGFEDHESRPRLNLDEPYLCLSGSSSAAWEQDRAYDAYLQLAQAIASLRCQVLVTPSCDGDAFLWRVARQLNLPYLHPRTPIRVCAGIVGKAKVFVSGRFHPAIMASNGGTPCVFLGSNSHKTLSLQSMLEYKENVEFGAIPSATDIPKIVAKTKELIEEQPRRRILEAAGRRCAEAVAVARLIGS